MNLLLLLSILFISLIYSGHPKILDLKNKLGIVREVKQSKSNIHTL